MEKHPFLKIIDGLYGKNNISILGLNSEFINSISENQYNIYTINEKWKQNKLTKQIQGFQVKFNILLFGSKNPAWDLFNHIPFDIIFLETNKNYEQMRSILLTSKKYKYIYINGFFIRKDYLE